MHALKDGYLDKLSTIKYSTLMILSVFIVEISLGLAVSSLAILSDGLHSLFDTLSSFILLLSARISLKPPDEEHTYGHEKFEALGGLIGSFLLTILATFIIIEAASRIIEGRAYINLDLSPMGFIALGYTLTIDILRMLLFRSTLSRESLLIRVGLYHAISDLGSTLIALFGFWLSTSHGIFYGDSLASLVLSALLITLSMRLAWGSIMELSDMVPRGVLTRIREEIQKESGGLVTCDHLKVRKVSNKFFIRATLKVPDYMSLKEAHDLTSRIEDKVVKIFGNADISFHIEPSGIKYMTTKEFIEKIARGFEGVVGIHDVNVKYRGGKAYVTLHVQVSPSTSLSEAHSIAEKIEETISKNISNIGNVLVHIEPSNIEFKRGQLVDDEEISEVTRLAAEKYKGELKVKHITTYVVNGVRHINIECSFNREISVEEAHKITSEIEETIKKKISEVTVTIRMEPEERREE